MDVVLATLALLLLSWLMALVALLVRLKLGSPVLFCQQRPGLRGRPFTIYKFRTMTEDRDEQGTWLPDAERLTPVGRFLRSTSLDELPELFNVLRGDMSLVGPRPEMPRYVFTCASAVRSMEAAIRRPPAKRLSQAVQGRRGVCAPPAAR